MKRNDYNIILVPCADMGQIDLYQLMEYLSNFNFPIMDTMEVLYCQDAFDIDFDLRIAIIEHDEKRVFLEMVR